MSRGDDMQRNKRRDGRSCVRTYGWCVLEKSCLQLALFVPHITFPHVEMCRKTRQPARRRSIIGSDDFIKLSLCLADGDGWTMCHPAVNCGAVHCGPKCCHNRVRQQPVCLLWHGLQEENKLSNLNGRIVSTETTRFRSRLALGASFCGGVRVSCHFHLSHFSVTRAHLNVHTRWLVAALSALSYLSLRWPHWWTWWMHSP